MGPLLGLSGSGVPQRTKSLALDHQGHLGPCTTGLRGWRVGWVAREMGQALVSFLKSNPSEANLIGLC